MLGKVRAPAIALLVSNIIGMVFAAIQLAMGPDPMGMNEKYFDMLNDSGTDLPPGFEEQFGGMMSAMGSAGYSLNIIGLLVGIFLVWGCIQMMNAQKYGVAMAAVIIGMIPCVGPCCVLGIPFGIWGLIVLSDVNVKALFQRNAQMGR